MGETYRFWGRGAQSLFQTTAGSDYLSEGVRQKESLGAKEEKEPDYMRTHQAIKVILKKRTEPLKKRGSEVNSKLCHGNRQEVKKGEGKGENHG